LPPNFKCADIVCDFCGWLAQVKTASVNSIDQLPDYVLGAAWKPQKERMAAGVYIPLFLVLAGKSSGMSVFFLSREAQEPDMFVPRKPLSKDAKRAGWQGFRYDLRNWKSRFLRIC
jgi:type II restriction enzyme